MLSAVMPAIMPAIFAQSARSFKIRIDDPSPWHVQRSGQPVRIHVTVQGSSATRAKIQAQWVAASGKKLSAPIRIIPGRRQALSSPGRTTGYYGLVFSSPDKSIAFPPQAAGFASQEYGFALLDRAVPRTVSATSPFGLVRGDILVKGSWDPWLSGQHVKTMTWNSVSAAHWSSELTARKRQGRSELPIVSGKDWNSDDTAPISTAQLRTIEARIRARAQKKPSVEAWELGIEENLSQPFHKAKYYFANLAAKARAVRQGLPRQASKAPRLVYNFEGFDYDALKRYIQSPAFAEFDVLASPPYRWKDFESPESWLPAHIKKLRELCAANGPDNADAQAMPAIWITEIGIPLRGNNDSDGFFGYPSTKEEVPGASRDYAAQYLIKCLTLALSERVERIYIYNYQNEGNDPLRAEDHFGLRSYAAKNAAQNDVPGFPMPSYVAYATMMRVLHERRFTRLTHPSSDIWSFEFAGENPEDRNKTLLIWKSSLGSSLVPWPRLARGLSKRRVQRITNLYGANQVIASTGLNISSQPLYVEFHD